MNAQTIGDIQFYDEHPKPVDFYAEVIQGLHRKPKLIPPKFFYDEAGSKLFDEVLLKPTDREDLISAAATEVVQCAEGG